MMPTTQQNTPIAPPFRALASTSSLAKKPANPGTPAMARQPAPIPK